MTKQAFTPDMQRFPNETAASWANRLKDMRGRLQDVEWYETPGGELRLRPIRNPQSKMEF